jgi:hypothetical protein
MREKAWRSRKRRTLLAGATGELAGATRLRQARPSSACTFSVACRSLITDLGHTLSQILMALGTTVEIVQAGSTMTVPIEQVWDPLC